jgi:HTH-type transcriptional regulator/antitoxin HigA
MKKSVDMYAWDNFDVSAYKLDSTSYYKSYLSFSDIISKLPKQELIKQGWLDSKDDFSALVPLFNNIVENKFQTLFRKNNTAHEALSALWLSKVSKIAKEKIISHDISSFEGLSKDNLKSLAKLSINEASILDLPDILATYGIVLIYEQGIKGMKLDGAVFRLSTGHPVIGISFRYSRLDSFWFTLMHELSHIVLHIKELDTPIFDDLDNKDSRLVEKQANKLTKDSFVEKSLWRNCEPKYQTGNAAVNDFANKINIHPAIIAGLLRHEKQSFTLYNDIINKLNVRKLVFANE